MSYQRWPPYIPVAMRRRLANIEMDSLRKTGRDVQPIDIAGRKITTTFWGDARRDATWSHHPTRRAASELDLLYSQRFPESDVAHLQWRGQLWQALVDDF